MDIPLKKLKSGFEIPVFGIGTWRIGGTDVEDPDNDDTGDINSIKRALEMGITHIDTAEFYAAGHAEELVGKAIKGYDRSKILITTKVVPNNLRYKDLLNSAQKSLGRLGTDYVDIYMIHCPNPYIPIEETMEAMDLLVDKNLIRFIGVSNFSIPQFEDAQKNTGNKIVCNQVQYNLIYRWPQKEGFIDFAQVNDVMVVAWRPLQKGIISQQNLDFFDNICKKYGKTRNQVAINWLISQKNTVAIAKSKNQKHLEENLGAIGWKMENEDIKILMEKFPDQQFSCDINRLTDTIKP
ncbi:MAG: aldo/keto reductase [Cyanobacteria bacterium]|nr:aldo/keto reductase [Cyanobacteriota bacterium]